METEVEQPIVNSHNEWDPLEEVILGVLEGSSYLPWDLCLEACMHEDYVEDIATYHREFGGKLRSEHQVKQVQNQLNEFVHILKQEGITIRQPEPTNQARPFASMEWKSSGGNAQANPRDSMLVVGNEIIECPMALRAKYFEIFSYRNLLKDYFKKGARWTAAPKPQLSNELYDPYWERSDDTYVTTEFEPIWDAADVARFGKDLIMQRSQVSNEFGAEWLQRHLGDDYRVHLVDFADDDPVHIDTTFVPLCPGKVLINPGRPIKQLPAIFEHSDWELLEAPRSTLPENFPAYKAYEWFHLNILMLDHKRVVVEKEEIPFIEALKDWGFEPIPCAFREAAVHYAGGFHCFTLDVRRRGELQSYF
jgi:glycine amidinotransferase